MRNLILICAFFISACTPQTIQSRPPAAPVSYITSTPSLTSTPNVIIINDTPLPTSTPHIYTVKSGDTISKLAEQFNISQDELRAANPDVSPNSMVIGSTLLIPDNSAVPAGAFTPTPVPAPVTQTVCHPSADGGLWCLALIQNNTDELIENVSAQITLLDENNTSLASQTAFAPLDIIPPRSSLPVYIYFDSKIPAKYSIQVQVLSANQLPLNNPRYLPAAIQKSIAQINGRTAQLSGQILLPAESSAATQVRVVAVAYDKYGIVVGMKRWEGGAIQPGGSISFSFFVSSLGAEIDAVEFFVETRP
ncbi:LysM peptidoglycan-binding domain-containing protein [Candidatus Villigracilis saccharophilus]|uniref:LysM peptidoglycan-binding domain-containing protein n=1 Tax=Candidatus Villigracilis saccharophilus TaxID=3140684 RepID=UPI003136C206|nr:LysM peptidoglycan-binding domain-containing protein [Anaerolineales bacterium]